jgi:hypothetical protein
MANQPTSWSSRRSSAPAIKALFDSMKAEALPLGWSAFWAAAIGSVWLLGRIIYFVGYRSDPKERFPGFFIQSLAHFALMLGALGGILYLAMS